jgi:hypothetical protein
VNLLSKKDFIIDGNKIRQCESNMANANLLQYMIYFHRFGFYDGFVDPIKKILEGTIVLFVSIILVATFPISFPLICYFRQRSIIKNYHRMYRK